MWNMSRRMFKVEGGRCKNGVRFKEESGRCKKV